MVYGVSNEYYEKSCVIGVEFVRAATDGSNRAVVCCLHSSSTCIVEHLYRLQMRAGEQNTACRFDMWHVFLLTTRGNLYASDVQRHFRPTCTLDAVSEFI